jgi:hypothetical protein
MANLVSNAETDTQIIAAARVPDPEETERLLHYAYEGKSIDF